MKIRQILIIIAGLLCITFLSNIKAQTANIFTGKFSSEGDVTAPGLMTLELSQQGSKLEGIGYYMSNKDDNTSGTLSVNGYVKDKKGYIRFRDQRGNVVADGSIIFKNSSTVYFIQTTKSPIVPNAAYLYPVNEESPTEKKVVTSRSYTGKYSNEGDTTAKGILSFEITQSGSKIEGIANYSTKDEQLDTGMLSVNGYVKDGIAYIRFRDQNGASIADGTLSSAGANTIFKQTTSTSDLPKQAILYR